MGNRTYTIVLAMVFALIAVLTCLIAVVLLWMFQQGGPPLMAVPMPGALPTPTLAPTIQIDLALEPSLVVPTAAPRAVLATSSPVNLVAPTSAVAMPTQPVFLSMPQQTPLRVVATATRAPRPTRQLSTPTSQGPTPTATLPGNFQFVADGDVKPDAKRACTGAAIFGYFRDAAGKPVAGARVKVYNQYLQDNNISAPSKPVGATDAGYYDFVINPKPSLWNVVVVDGTGAPISPEVQVIRPEGVEVCYFQLDWKATR